MKQITIRNMPEDLWKELKKESVDKDITLQEHIVNVLASRKKEKKQ